MYCTLTTLWCTRPKLTLPTRDQNDQLQVPNEPDVSNYLPELNARYPIQPSGVSTTHTIDPDYKTDTRMHTHCNNSLKRIKYFGPFCCMRRYRNLASRRTLPYTLSSSTRDTNRASSKMDDNVVATHARRKEDSVKQIINLPTPCVVLCFCIICFSLCVLYLRFYPVTSLPGSLPAWIPAWQSVCASVRVSLSFSFSLWASQVLLSRSSLQLLAFPPLFLETRCETAACRVLVHAGHFSITAQKV